MLAVSASEFASIWAARPAFNLPESADELNVIEIAASELSVASLKSAITTAGRTQAPDLIVLRTTDDAHTLTFESAADEIKLAFDSTKYGALTIVGFGTRPLTIAGGVADVGRREPRLDNDRRRQRIGDRRRRQRDRRNANPLQRNA